MGHHGEIREEVYGCHTVCVCVCVWRRFDSCLPLSYGRCMSGSSCCRQGFTAHYLFKSSHFMAHPSFTNKESEEQRQRRQSRPLGFFVYGINPLLNNHNNNHNNHKKKVSVQSPRNNNNNSVTSVQCERRFRYL